MNGSVVPLWPLGYCLAVSDRRKEALEIVDSNSVIHWTQDGRGMLFIDFRNGVTNLLSHALDSGPPKQLTNFTKEQFYSFDFSPDGRLALSRGFWTNDVILISGAP